MNHWRLIEKKDIFKNPNSKNNDNYCSILEKKNYLKHQENSFWKYTVHCNLFVLLKESGLPRYVYSTKKNEDHDSLVYLVSFSYLRSSTEIWQQIHKVQ